MPFHLLRDLEQLKKEILTVGTLAEAAVEKSVLALMERRTDLAEAVLRGDKELDRQEVAVEDMCLKVLALHQPVAADLRFVVTVLKVNNDLERVGDLAGNIASRVLALAKGPVVPVPDEIKRMADAAQSMVRRCLDALVGQDTALARAVLQEDEEVDALHKSIFGVLEARMAERPEQIATEIQLLSVSRYLERIADLATNIAEDVVFLVDGDVVRHQTW